jgi:hypothetical protein
VFGVTSIAATPDKSSFKTASRENAEWSVYVDPRFNFSIAYPSYWHIIPRDDSDPNVVSGVLTFALFDPENATLSEEHNHGQVTNPNIVIGLYMAELPPDQTLREWTTLYENATNTQDERLIQRQPRNDLKLMA